MANFEPRPVDVSMPGSGIYTWVIATDTFYCDDLAASVLGIEKARNALSIKEYLARIHQDDLPRMTRAIFDTIISGKPCNEQCRICRPDGPVRQVVSLGACFRDSSGRPSHYSGILVPVPAMEESECGGETAIIAHLVAAHDLADSNGWGKLADKIVDTLEQLTWPENGPEAGSAGRVH